MIILWNNPVHCSRISINITTADLTIYCICLNRIHFLLFRGGGAYTTLSTIKEVIVLTHICYYYTYLQCDNNVWISLVPTSPSISSNKNAQENVQRWSIRNLLCCNFWLRRRWHIDSNCSPQNSEGHKQVAPQARFPIKDLIIIVWYKQPEILPYCKTLCKV